MHTATVVVSRISRQSALRLDARTHGAVCCRGASAERMMAAGGGGALPEGIGKNGRATKACPVRPFRPPAFILLNLTCVTLFFTFPSPQACCFETLSLGLLVRDCVRAMEQLTDTNDAA